MHDNRGYQPAYNFHQFPAKFIESFSVKFTQLFLHEIKMNGKSQLYTIAAALSFMTRDENNPIAHIASI